MRVSGLFTRWRAFVHDRMDVRACEHARVDVSPVCACVHFCTELRASQARSAHVAQFLPRMGAQAEDIGSSMMHATIDSMQYSIGKLQARPRATALQQSAP